MRIESLGFRRRWVLASCLAFASAHADGLCQALSDVGNPPQAMRLCTDHCETLIWENDHYEGKADGSGEVISKYAIISWKPDDIRFTGAAVKRGPFGMETRAVFKGTIATAGGSIANPKVDVFTNRLPLIKGATYTLTWSDQSRAAIASSPQTGLPVSALLNPASVPSDEADPLPRWLYECDVLPSRKNCSIWKLLPRQYAGHYESTYEGKWPDSGGVGKIVVTRFDRGSLEMSRKDETGATMGLTANYTGAWNGTELTGGKMSWSWNGHSAIGSWTLTSAAPPLSPEELAVVPAEMYYRTIDGLRDKHGVQNNYRAPLTAYVLRARDTGPIHVEDFRITQADILPPDGRRDLVEVYDVTNWPGFQVIAAIFADGAARGSEIWTEATMEKRKDQLWTYEAMARDLCSLGIKHQSGSAVTDLLKANKSTYVRNASQNAIASKYINGGGEQAYDAVLGSMTGNLSTGADIKKALAAIDQKIANLRADPVKNREGRPYFSDSSPTGVCKLP